MVSPFLFYPEDIADTQISLKLSNHIFIELAVLDELEDLGKQSHSLVMKMLHISKRMFISLLHPSSQPPSHYLINHILQNHHTSAFLFGSPGAFQ